MKRGLRFRACSNNNATQTKTLEPFIFTFYTLTMCTMYLQLLRTHLPNSSFCVALAYLLHRPTTNVSHLIPSYESPINHFASSALLPVRLKFASVSHFLCLWCWHPFPSTWCKEGPDSLVLP